jgi:hypothetical protein
MRIYDELGRERDRDWLETMFGPQVRVDASTESPAFRLVEVRASTSDSAVVTVLDENGHPMQGLAVVFAHTSGAQVVREKTNENGQISIPLDRSYRYGVPAQAGPCHAGIPRQPTDVIYGLGEVIVAGTANRHLDIAFQWLEDPEVTEPEPSTEEPSTTPADEPETPPDGAEASPPTDVPWQQLLEKLDTIIALLENLDR